jgi:hypothetical protein
MSLKYYEMDKCILGASFKSFRRGNQNVKPTDGMGILTYPQFLAALSALVICVHDRLKSPQDHLHSSADTAISTADAMIRVGRI